MGFKNGTNDAFQQWFNESVVLFRELTSNITAEERRQLLDDPGTYMKKKYIFTSLIKFFY